MRHLPPELVGNAGLQLTNATQATVDGIEATFAVNVLANHILINELHEHFRVGARIIITTSDTHFGDFSHNLGMVPAPHWDAPNRLATRGAAKDARTAAAGRTRGHTNRPA
jgi:NAD(P)-dependent dehydrogenase (short-subunit alcohol dehydrogenase family)